MKIKKTNWLAFLKYFLVWCLGGISFVVAIDIYEARSYIMNNHIINPKVIQLDLKKYDLETKNIKSGEPKIMTNTFSDAFNYRSRYGVFESGPSVWNWHFNTNETIYILSGQVLIDYQGERLVLNPGDVTHFKIGTDAVFNVPVGFKKMWFTYNPSVVVSVVMKIKQKILHYTN
jgi:uncharacterized cupin superfamily protein